MWFYVDWATLWHSKETSLYKFTTELVVSSVYVVETHKTRKSIGIRHDFLVNSVHTSIGNTNKNLISTIHIKTILTNYHKAHKYKLTNSPIHQQVLSH